MNDNDLTMKARGVAANLTYNDDEAQAAAKHLLLEMAHRIDAKNIRVHKNGGISNAIGKSRFMTLRERICYFLFRVLPERV